MIVRGVFELECVELCCDVLVIIVLNILGQRKCSLGGNTMGHFAGVRRKDVS